MSGRQIIWFSWWAINIGVAIYKFNNPSLNYKQDREFAPSIYWYGVLTFFWVVLFCLGSYYSCHSKTKQALTQSVLMMNFSVMSVYVLHLTGFTLTLRDVAGFPLDIARYVEWLFDMDHLAAIIAFSTRANEASTSRAINNVWYLTCAGLIGSLLQDPWSDAFLILAYSTHCIAVTSLWDMYGDAIRNKTDCNIDNDALSLNQYITNYAWHACKL